MFLSVFKTKGHSMEPKLMNGSFFIASSIPYLFFKPRVRDIIVFEAGGKTIVKKIVKIEKGKYIVEGENRTDSKQFEPIQRKDILGKIVFKLT